MAYILNGTTIRRPNQVEARNSTQMAQQRTLDGSINRDYFGSNKRAWVLSYDTVNATDHTIISNIYVAYLDSETPVSWQVTETNYTVSATEVHVDLVERSFAIKGTDYLSDFDLILTEA